MNYSGLAVLGTTFICASAYSPPQRAADIEERPKPSWQMISVVGTYAVKQVGGKQTVGKKTVNFFLEGTYGDGRVCLETPKGACDTFDVRFFGRKPESGRFRMSGLAGQDEVPGAHVAVLDTTTGRAVKCTVQVNATAIGSVACSPLPH